MTDVVFTENKFDRLPSQDREFHNFTLDNDGKVARRTLLKGEIVVTGLSKGLRITTMEVSDVAIKLPITPFSERNTISLVVLSGSTLFVGPSNVTPDRVVGVTSGWEVDAGEGINFDVKGEVEIYGICRPSESCLIKIMEIA